MNEYAIMRTGYLWAKNTVKDKCICSYVWIIYLFSDKILSNEIVSEFRSITSEIRILFKNITQAPFITKHS